MALSDGTVRKHAGPTAQNSIPKNKLTDDERMQILQTINQPEFANLSQGAIVPTLADRELFIGSESTMYRMMKEAKQLCHCGKARRHTVLGRKHSLQLDLTRTGAGT